MLPPVVFSTLIFLTPVIAFGILDKTVEECDQVYGPPHKMARPIDIHSSVIRAKYNYLWDEFYVSAAFTQTDTGAVRCVSIRYEPQSLVGPRLVVAPVKATPTVPIKKISTAAIERILALNAGGSSWQRTRSGHAWMRWDKQAFAIEHQFEARGVLCNSLSISHVALNPDLAVQVTEDLPSE